MARFLFVTWWGGGNLTPVRVLGADLRRAGHDVRVLGPARLADELAAVDVEVVAQSGGFTATPDEVAAEIARTPTDAIVVDFMQPESFAAAEASGVPWAPLIHTLGQSVLDDEHSTMLAFAPLAAINDVRSRFGLPAVDDPLELLAAADRVLVAGPKAVDRPRRTQVADERVRHLGALLEPAGPDAGWTPPVLGRSLVVASLGTTPMDEAPLLQRVLDASASLPDLALFATVGEHLDPSSFSAPPNATVAGLVRHTATLPYAAALVTHAGLGTVTAGLAHGVPLVCVPLGRDQFDNAARVEELGAGITLPATASAEDIVAALERVLSSEELRVAAGEVAGRIADESPPGSAVAELAALAGARG